jgi:hypothetical protein
MTACEPNNTIFSTFSKHDDDDDDDNNNNNKTKKRKHAH